MGTRSMIGYYNKETGEVTATYAHWDGYYSGVGASLVEYYNTDTLAYGIANLGYISSVMSNMGATIEAAANKDIPVPYESVDQYLKNAWDYSGAEYIYLWDGTAWFGAAWDEQKFTDMNTLLLEDA